MTAPQSRHPRVQVVTTARMIEPPTLDAMTVTLTYYAGEPLAVHAIFAWADAAWDDGSGQAEWLLSRDLLIDGRDLHVGTMDVEVWPQLTSVMIRLGPPGQESTVLALPAADVDLFVRRCLDLVPVTLEGDLQEIIIDTELAALLGGA